MDLTAYASDRTFVADPVSITLTQKLQSGDLTDTITDARRMEWNELNRTFGPATLSTESVGFQVWVASFTNCTAIDIDDEITYTSLIDGSKDYIVKDRRLVKFEQQYIVHAVPKAG